MNRFILFALLANSWAQAQDGVFLADTAAGARATMDNREVVVRFPVIRTAAPPAKCILLVDSYAKLQLTNTSKGLVRVDANSVSKSKCLMLVILDKPLPEEPARVVVLGDLVFWDVRVSRPLEPREAGWMSFPVEAGLEVVRCLWDASRVFGVEEKHVFDLRLTDAERARPADLQGQLPTTDIAEIRQMVFEMARQQILARLPFYPSEEWHGVLRKWPGRNALEISASADGRRAAVYYAPNAGYQMEKIDGKWTIVGG